MIGEVDLLDALEAHSGLVCFVGAGGKKTIPLRPLVIQASRLRLNRSEAHLAFAGSKDHFRPGRDIPIPVRCASVPIQKADQPRSTLGLLLP